MRWDAHFSSNEYPQAWVLRLWRTKYNAEQLTYAFGVAVRALNDGRIKPPTVDDLSKYISGVLRHRTAEDVVIEKEIADHIIDCGVSEQRR
jgi:hypothetical protein